MVLRSDDIDLFYDVRGKGPDVVLLHPFPSSHSFWNPVAPYLDSRYRLITPDLRAMGASGVGSGIATMEKHAQDLLGLCDTLDVGRATFVGCSVGGYILFEFWRRHRERVKALVFMNTKAPAEPQDALPLREKAAQDALEKGPEFAISQTLPKMLSQATLGLRLDVVEAAKATMRGTSAEGFAAATRGIGARPDSVSTLAQIDVPTLVIGAEDDAASPVAELARIAQGIRGAELKVVPKAGHYAAFEQPGEVGKLLRDFLDRTSR